MGTFSLVRHALTTTLRAAPCNAGLFTILGIYPSPWHFSLTSRLDPGGDRLELQKRLQRELEQKGQEMEKYKVSYGETWDDT